jgi:hypothetical protein
MKELQTGRLHGAQNSKHGTWRVAESCFEAWLIAQPCAHKAVAA